MLAFYSRLDAYSNDQGAKQTEYIEAKIKRQLRSITFVNVMNGTLYV
jgi:hypothetical protein